MANSHDRRKARRAEGHLRLLTPVEDARVICDAANYKTPERGQRTPKATLQRWDRNRFAELTLDRLVTILRRGEDGDVEELVDLWLRMLKTDAHLRSVWESRISPVASSRWEVTPPSDLDPLTAESAKRLSDACGEALRGIPELPKLFGALLNAIGVGFGVGEIVWGRGTLLGQPAWVPIEILPIHARRFRFDDYFEIGLFDDGRAVGALRDAGWPVRELSSRSLPIAALPEGKYVVHMPAGPVHDYPTATGLVHSVARWWWVKQTVFRYWLAGAEVAANPRIIGKILQNAAGVTAEELLAQLEKLAADGIMVHRDGTEINFIEGKAQASGEVWAELARKMDLAMSKAILGSTLNVEVEATGGNRAAAESQDATTIRPRQQQDQAQMWSSISRDVFCAIRDFNPHLFSPTTPLPIGKTTLVEEQVAIDQLVIDSGWVKVDQLLQSRGLPPIGGEIGAQFVAPITRPSAAATTPGVSTPEVVPPKGPAPVPPSY